MIDLTPQHLKLVRDVLTQMIPGVRVCAFGSRVTGKAKRFSDLDLAIMGNEPIATSLLYQIKDAFEESDLPIRVDIVDWHQIGDDFKKIIQKNRVDL
jgi:type I restriction enzyme S subunit